MDSGKDITFLFNVEICQCRTTCKIKRNFDYSPSGIGKQFSEKYVFEKVFSWNYLEFAIPRFLSKKFFFGGEGHWFFFLKTLTQ